MRYKDEYERLISYIVNLLEVQFLSSDASKHSLTALHNANACTYSPLPHSNNVCESCLVRVLSTSLYFDDMPKYINKHLVLPVFNKCFISRM
jgi:hypothetical protein